MLETRCVIEKWLRSQHVYCPGQRIVEMRCLGEMGRLSETRCAIEKWLGSQHVYCPGQRIAEMRGLGEKDAQRESGAWKVGLALVEAGE